MSNVNSSSDGSVTRWIHALRVGDHRAASELWDRFSQRMRRLAKSRTQPSLTRGAYDEEDVALSAFAGFCRALGEGNYPELAGRDELWRLLATFTFRKANERAEAAGAQKRGGAQATFGDALADVPSATAPPDLLAMMNEQCTYLMSLLADPELEMVAVRKLEGCTNEEIAEELGYTKRTVQRMMGLIRRLWEPEK